MVAERVEDPGPLGASHASEPGRGGGTHAAPAAAGASAAVREGRERLTRTQRSTLVRYALLIALVLGTLESTKAFLIARARGIDFGPGRALAANMSWWLLWVPLAPVVFWLARVAPLRGSRIRAAVVHTFGCAAVSLLHLGVSSVFVWGAALPPPGFTNTVSAQFRALLAGYLLMEVVTYGSILAGYTVFVSRERMRAAEEERVRLQVAAADAHAERARLESLMTAARLRALRSELDPHFFFNSLNSVSALAQRGDGAAAVRMISRIADLLRLTMDGRGEAEVTVAEEIDLARLYLEIEEIRFGDRLRTQISVDPAVRQARVPSLILQPLVENAIRHGVSQVRGPVRVEISAHAADGRLHLAVRDSGPGLAAGPGAPAFRRAEGAHTDDPPPERVPGARSEDCAGAAGGGLGIRNVRERLETLHGGAAGLSLRGLPSGGTEALVTVPLDLPARAELTR